MSKIILAAFLIISFLSTSVPSQCKNDPPTKNELIELLGNPTQCNNPEKSENIICFGTFGVFVRAKIDSSGIVETVSMGGCAISDGKRVVELIISKIKSGKLIKTSKNSEECDYAKFAGGRGKTSIEEYECMTISYSESNCGTSCRHYGISISWKK